MKMTSEASDATRRHFEALLGPAHVSFHLAMSPVPASRPRVYRNGGVGHLPRYAKFLTAGKIALRALVSEPTDTSVIVHIDNVVPRPKTTKRDYPVGDVDNYAKGVLDIMTMTRKFFTDDDQVVGLSVWKRYASGDEEPGVYVSMYILKDLYTHMEEAMLRHVSERTTYLVEQARKVEMSPAEVAQQRRNFAYGNAAFENPLVTEQMIEEEDRRLGLDDD